jgi:5-methylcytosine-specific restriction endonuclease McrA
MSTFVGICDPVEIISRKDAQRRGLARYFTGKPCCRGHTVQRRTSSGACLTCEAETSDRWHKNNPDKAKEKDRRYKDKNRSAVRESARAWKRKNPDKVKAWVDANPTYNSEWIDANRGKVNARLAARKKQIRRATPKWLTLEHKDQIRELYELANICGMHVDHIHPIKGENVCGLHVPWNLQLLTPSENLSKGNRLVTA